MSKRLGKFFIALGLIAYFSLFFAQKINLTTADLGRHITNGKVFFETGKIVSTNYYSYTQPEFRVVNHHWLSGVAFYLIHQVGNFTGLSVFYIFLSGLTTFLVFKTAEKRTGFVVALILTLLTLPLICERKEIRPEGFSYLFLAFYLYLFEKFKNQEINFKKLAIILFISQIFWVNLHLFFIMGIGISLAYLFGEFSHHWFHGLKGHKVKEYFAIFVLLIVASLINPNHIFGLLEPFNIFKEYGYMIVENQSVFFMQKRTQEFSYIYFEILTLVLVYFLLNIIFTKKIKYFFTQISLIVFFTMLSYFAIRGFPMFGIFFIYFVASYLESFYKHKTSKFLYGILVLLIILTLLKSSYFSLRNKNFGIGLIPHINNSAEFFIKNNLVGPIFNNYDNGGYLIYHLYGKEKVFVDNRPEAYSVPFFTELYVPIQENDVLWQKAQEDYNFNVIYFYRLDATPWAQPFLIERIQDENWVPVYVDDFVLILVRKNEQNQDIINSYELPKNLFVVTKL